MGAQAALHAFRGVAGLRTLTQYIRWCAILGPGQLMNAEAVQVLKVPAKRTLLQRRTLRRKLLQSLQSSHRQLFIDFSDRESLDADDLELVLECAEAAAGHDIEFTIISGSAPNRVVLEVARIASVVPVFQSFEEASLRFRPSKTTQALQAESRRGTQ